MWPCCQLMANKTKSWQKWASSSPCIYYKDVLTGFRHFHLTQWNINKIVTPQIYTLRMMTDCHHSCATSCGDSFKSCNSPMKIPIWSKLSQYKALIRQRKIYQFWYVCNKFCLQIFLCCFLITYLTQKNISTCVPEEKSCKKQKQVLKTTGQWQATKGSVTETGPNCINYLLQ